MSEMSYEVWKTKSLAEKYLDGVRGAIPLAKEQFDIMLRLIKMNKG
jgi:tRNA (cmo5U34)-methyltransferase